MSGPRALQAPPLSEQEFQALVIDTAHALGWQHMHARRSRGKHGAWVTATNVAWPDLTLWSERQRRVIYAELKSEKGVTSDAQLEVLRSLAAAGQEVRIWRPSDFDLIARDLRGVQ